MDLKFGALMFKKIREMLESFKVRNITFCCSHLRVRKIMCKFSLYIETKISIMLNIFDIEDFLGSLLVDRKIKYMRRLLDFWKTSL